LIDATDIIEDLRRRALCSVETVSEDDVLELYDKVLHVQQRVKQLRAEMTQALIRWIDFNGSIERGDVRYYVSDRTTWKQRQDNTHTMEGMLTATGGDLEAIVACLRADPWKHGACREALGETFAQHFVQEKVRDLKTGKPKRCVKTARTDIDYRPSSDLPKGNDDDQAASG
jgi:hypothetical protein